MNIAIIGTGNLGTGLAHVFSKTRHAVIFGGRTIDKGGLAARQFTRDTGLDIRGTSVSDAARQSDIIILAAFGTTSKALSTYALLDKQLRRHFAGHEIFWSFSSRLLSSKT